MILSEIRSIMHGYHDSNDLIYVSNLILSISEEKDRDLAINYVKCNIANKTTKPIDVNSVAVQNIKVRKMLRLIGAPMKFNVGILCANRQLRNAWSFFRLLCEHHNSKGFDPSLVNHSSHGDLYLGVAFNKNIKNLTDGVLIQKLETFKIDETDLDIVICMPTTSIPFPYSPNYPTLWLNCDLLIVLDEIKHVDTPRLMCREDLISYHLSNLINSNINGCSYLSEEWKCKSVYLCYDGTEEELEVESSMMQSFQSVLHSFLNELVRENCNTTTRCTSLAQV